MLACHLSIYIISYRHNRLGGLPLGLDVRPPGLYTSPQVVQSGDGLFPRQACIGNRYAVFETVERNRVMSIKNEGTVLELDSPRRSLGRNTLLALVDVRLEHDSENVLSGLLPLELFPLSSDAVSGICAAMGGLGMTHDALCNLHLLCVLFRAVAMRAVDLGRRAVSAPRIGSGMKPGLTMSLVVTPALASFATAEETCSAA